MTCIPRTEHFSLISFCIPLLVPSICSNQLSIGRRELYVQVHMAIMACSTLQSIDKINVVTVHVCDNVHNRDQLATMDLMELLVRMALKDRRETKEKRGNPDR